ncbi:MAG: hypothetical protein HRT88_06225, partial [Lentisphaeraceae bacterium]|nr:hypothetical protein [Lentisphaeraceae bacterium]
LSVVTEAKAETEAETETEVKAETETGGGAPQIAGTNEQEKGQAIVVDTPVKIPVIPKLPNFDPDIIADQSGGGN